MPDYKLNLLLATLLLGSTACTEMDADGTDGLIAATVDRQPSAWESRVAANAARFDGLVLLYASNELGGGIRLTVPNEPGTYACSDAIRQEGGFMSVSILYVEERGTTPALTSDSRGECTITLDRAGDSAGWAGTFSGVLWRPDANLSDVERRIELTNGWIQVPQD